MNIDEQMAELIDLRSDPKLTSARYDEIISLRMMLLDIADALADDEDPKAMRVRGEIRKRSMAWGKKGDCV